VFETFPRRLLLTESGRPVDEVAGGLEVANRSPPCTREASGESGDPSREFPDRPGQLPELPGDHRN
jgi:hypothetical protein